VLVRGRSQEIESRDELSETVGGSWLNPSRYYHDSGWPLRQARVVETGRFARFWGLNGVIARFSTHGSRLRAIAVGTARAYSMAAGRFYLCCVLSWL
jgi:hypothetical protein